MLDDSGKYDTLMAFLEVRGFREFEELVDRYGASWDDDIYIYLCKGYTAGEAINVLVYTTEAGEEKLYNGTITVPEGKSLALGNLYTPTIALSAVVAEPNTILYFANEKASLMLDSTVDF